MVRNPAPAALPERILSIAAWGGEILPVYGVRADGTCTCNQQGCEDQGKHPIFDNWPKMATSNEGTIRRWWRVWNGSNNFGWKMGSRFVGVDLDRKNGNDGIATLHQLEAENSPLPRALSASTPTGGGHIVLQVPEDLKLRPMASWRPGIDIRAGNAYIVVEPSVTPNGRYRWWNFQLPPVAPQWLLDALPRAGEDSAAEGFDAVVEEGADLPSAARLLLTRSSVFKLCWNRTRHKEGDLSDSAWDCTFLLTYLMSRPDAEDQELADVLSAYRERWGGWGSHKKVDYAARTIRAARQRVQHEEAEESEEPPPENPGPEIHTPPGPPRASSPVRDLPAFPLKILPAAAAALAENMAEAWGVDPALYAIPALAVLSISVGSSSVLELPAGQVASSALWTAVVAPTGSGKTPAASAMLRPIREREKELDQQYRRSLDNYREQLAASRVAEKPRRELLTVGDVTWEMCVRKLADNPFGLLWIRDEILGLFGSLDAYKPSGKGFADQDLLSTWSGEPIRRLRMKDDEETLVDRPWLAMFGGIQPALLARLGDNASGRLSRLLAWSVDRKVPEEAGDVNPGLVHEWRELVRGLLHSRQLYHEGEPYRVRLSRGALLVWKREQKWRRGQMLEADDDHRALLAKLDQHAGRLTLDLWAGYCGTAVNLPEVDESTMEGAWTLAKAFFQHQVALFVGGEDWVNPHQRAAFDAAERFHQWLLARGGRLTFRDVQRANPPGARDAGRLHALIGHWEEHGYGRLTTEKKAGKTGPATRWLVCRDVEEESS